jgi:hypothetical protein
MADPTTQQMQQVAAQAAQANGVPVQPFMALLESESSWRPHVASGQGGHVGPGQLGPDEGQSLGVNINDPVQNIQGSARYFKQKLNTWGNLDDAVRAYHGGDDTKQWGPKGEAEVANVARLAPNYAGFASPPNQQQPPASGPLQSQVTPTPAPAQPNSPLDDAWGHAGPSVSAATSNPIDDAWTGKAPQGWTDDQKHQIQAYVPQAKNAADLEGFAKQLSGGKWTIGNAQDTLDAYHANGRVGGVNDVQPSGTTPTPPTQTADQGLGFEQGLVRPWDNAAIWAQAGLDKIGLAQPINDLGQLLGMNTVDQSVAGHKAYIGQQEAQGHVPGGWGDLAGNIVSGLPLLVATKNPAVLGGLGGALNTNDPTNAGHVALDTGIGMLGGKVMGALTDRVSGVLSPKISAAVQALHDAGVQLTPGQIAGGMLKRIEDGASSIPFVGDMIKGAQRRSLESFNTSAINRSLAPIGQQVPDGLTGHAAVGYADNAISSAYKTLLPKLTVNADPEFVQGVSDAMKPIGELPPDRSAQVQKIVRDTLGPRFDNAGGMSGQAFQDADSKLGQLGREYTSSGDPEQRKMGSVFRNVQGELRSMLERSNPDHADELHNINTGFANLVRVEGASAKATGGVFSPAQLGQAVRQFDSSSRDKASSMGQALMQDLSDAGKQVLPSSVADSGTPFRLMLASALGGGAMGGHAGAVITAAGIAKTAGAALPLAAYTKVGQRVIQGAALAQRPASAQALAKGLSALKTPMAVAGGYTAAQAANGQ